MADGIVQTGPKHSTPPPPSSRVQFIAGTRLSVRFSASDCRSKTKIFDGITLSMLILTLTVLQGWIQVVRLVSQKFSRSVMSV